SETQSQTPNKEGKKMKSMTANVMWAAAALAIVTGVASAQTYRAEIPFAFQAGNKTMAAGSYQVSMRNGQRGIVIFANYDANQAAVVLARAGSEWAAASANEAPAITFECGIGRCALSGLRTGPAQPVLTFPHRSPGNGEQASVTEVRLVKANAD